jgi:hypothetical protein
MARPVDHRCLRPLLTRSSNRDNVEATIAKEKRRPPRETASGGCIQNLDFNSRIGGSLRVFGRISESRGLLVPRLLILPDSIVRAAANHSGEKDPPPNLHRKLFQSATVSGKM